jgi:hypothetical protein
MEPFFSRFPDLAVRETRCVRVFAPHGSLTPGNYGFAEHYCNDSTCDCRRVLFLVSEESAPDIVLAGINFGWEDEAFYARWLHGDTEGAREIVSASLDPLQPFSPRAPAILRLFRDLLLADADYVARLKRHYQMFKTGRSREKRPR